VRTLLQWCRDGGDVQARLPLLSAWLGHVDPKNTYWYLTEGVRPARAGCRTTRAHRG